MTPSLSLIPCLFSLREEIEIANKLLMGTSVPKLISLSSQFNFFLKLKKYLKNSVLKVTDYEASDISLYKMLGIM